MPLIVHPASHPALSDAELAPWRSVPTSIVSDERNRSGATNGSIRRLSPGQSMVGQAVTVETMVADNLAIHHAVANSPKGTVLVVDARGHMGNAVWGGILQRAAELHGLAGVVIDGLVRDVAELRASSMPCYSVGIVPAGPHKAWGGTINGTVQVGGCLIEPGDIVLGDDDGVAVVPFGRRGEILEGCRKRLEAEKDVLRRLEAGESTVEVFGLGV